VNRDSSVPFICHRQPRRGQALTGWRPGCSAAIYH